MPTAAPTSRIHIGCAGWNVPRNSAAKFPREGSHLQRYAGRLTAVEINTSFYRPHRPATYARWATSVSADFRFSVKVPKQITHQLRLRDAAELTEEFFQQASTLGDRLGCFLVQLPPSLQYEADVADAFFSHWRQLFTGNIACEPRHATWFTTHANNLLRRHAVARVAADPALHPAAEQPAGYTRFQYFRLHGSPQTYHSCYADEFLSTLAAKLILPEEDAREIWCIFDNTAAGHAAENALQLQALLEQA